MSEQKPNPVGRPLKFKSPEELQEKIDAYFESIKEPIYIDNNGAPQYEPATITGLALALGCYRETLLNYEKTDEFFDTIKTAKQRCEHYAEKKLLSGAPATGAIFALKNYGWKDTQDINNNHTFQKMGSVIVQDDSGKEELSFNVGD